MTMARQHITLATTHTHTPLTSATSGQSLNRTLQLHSHTVQYGNITATPNQYSILHNSEHDLNETANLPERHSDSTSHAKEFNEKPTNMKISQP